MRKITEKKPSVRLPKHVVPVRYSILLHPDLEIHTFTGEETISLKLEKNVREITLHCLELVITSAKILFGREMLEADAISYDEKAETATFYFSKSIPKGNAKLMLAWTGILNDNMRGFYKSRYTVEGSERFMATTQFEATDARRCIPSFDEPAQKAVFDVSLVVGEGKTAISNTMPVATREHSAGFNVVSFAPTPKMSTYLLAFIVGDFEYLEATTKRGVKVRVYTIPGKKEQGRFALECGVKTLDLYEEYFAINYPLPVLDMIAIPDFAAGAMENWGAVTYRETILIDETATSLAIRQWVAIVVAHELAHQWFGNLVTMEWWTDLWLNILLSTSSSRSGICGHSFCCKITARRFVSTRFSTRILSKSKCTTRARSARSSMRFRIRREHLSFVCLRNISAQRIFVMVCVIISRRTATKIHARSICGNRLRKSPSFQ
jgi:puromycin-sensitive aminopeptidase